MKQLDEASMGASCSTNIAKVVNTPFLSLLMHYHRQQMKNAVANLLY